MPDVEIEFHERNLAALRSDPGVASLIEGIASGWVGEANGTLPEGVGYRMAVHDGDSRRGPYMVTRVFTASRHAKHSNAVHNTLAGIVAAT